MRSVTPIVSLGSWARCGVYLVLFLVLYSSLSRSSRAETPAKAPVKHPSLAPPPQVPLDVESLRTQFKRAIPTANIIPIIYGANGVILTGTVDRAEDVDIILRVARSHEGLEIVNALRVGDVRQVQLDVVVVRVKRDLTSNLLIPFLNQAGKVNKVEHVNDTPFSCLLHSQSAARDFVTIIRTLKQENLAEVLAESSLTTMSGAPANFRVGGPQTIPQPGGLGTISVTYMEFGTELHFLPIVLSNGKIHLELEPELNSIDNAFGINIPGTRAARLYDDAHSWHRRTRTGADRSHRRPGRA